MNFPHFFIDRPIFAGVISIVITLVGGIALSTLSIEQYPQIAPPTIQVTTNYPGANAKVVSETVATPIEQQVNGVENMLYMSSQSTSDGNMTLSITFKLGTNLDTAQVLVQDRVAIAIPVLPAEVQRIGVTTKKQSPDTSLTGVGATLSDPVLELHQGNPTLVVNDNWKTRQDGTSQEAEVSATTIAPAHDLESAIVVTLNPGSYTAVLSSKTGVPGIGVVEVYDLAQGANSQLSNISSRGFVDVDNDVMIGGLIVGGPQADGKATVLVRALGPSLVGSGVQGALLDPQLELHDNNGATLATNDNWKINDQSQRSQESAIRATTVPPPNDAEAAIITTLSPGAYTAVVRGKNNSTGIGLVEVYNLH